jgi:hypothetical protein
MQDSPPVPTENDEASLPAESVRNGPNTNLNQYRTFTVRRKAAKVPSFDLEWDHTTRVTATIGCETSGQGATTWNRLYVGHNANASHRCGGYIFLTAAAAAAGSVLLLLLLLLLMLLLLLESSC